MYAVDVYDEWHNIAYMRNFIDLKEAIASGNRVLEEDKTEQFMGYAIFDLSTSLIVARRYHGDKEVRHMEPYETEKFFEVTRFELMEL